MNQKVAASLHMGLRVRLYLLNAYPRLASKYTSGWFIVDDKDIVLRIFYFSKTPTKIINILWKWRSKDWFMVRRSHGVISLSLSLFLSPVLAALSRQICMHCCSVRSVSNVVGFHIESG